MGCECCSIDEPEMRFTPQLFNVQVSVVEACHCYALIMLRHYFVTDELHS